MKTLLLVLCAAPALAAQTTDRARVQVTVDSIVNAQLAGGRAAGVSVAVVRGRDTLVLKGYGSADLELRVPTPDRAVYEIGSVTKQFTSASVLLLAEQGKLSLDDPLTKYLPNYPMQGRTVTIRRLLDHSSGITGYTEMPAFGTIMAQQLPRDTLVKLFSAMPFKFEPGEGVAYNNSAYFLLGLIIEKASGTSYEEFVEKNLFVKFGMPDSRYCSNAELIERRARGYEFTQGGLRNRSHIEHTWPYSAGSLCSTAGDLAAWSQALHGGRVLTPASYRLLTEPAPLNDGTKIRYAMGFVNDSIGGKHAIHHSGGINGYLSDMAWFPDDQLVIAVLVNTSGPVNPSGILNAIANVIHGPAPAPTVVALDHPASDYIGTYRGFSRGPDSLNVTVSDSGGVRFRIGNGPPTAARYAGNDTFMIGRNRLTFVRSGGRVTALRADLVSVVSLLRKR